jgi:hypothetical protein
MLFAQLRTWRPWIVHDLWFRGDGPGGRGGQGYKNRNDGKSSGSGAGRKAVQTPRGERRSDGEGLRHYCICSSQAQASPTHAEAPSRITATVLESRYCRTEWLKQPSSTGICNCDFTLSTKTRFEPRSATDLVKIRICSRFLVHFTRRNRHLPFQFDQARGFQSRDNWGPSTRYLCMQSRVFYRRRVVENPDKY